MLPFDVIKWAELCVRKAHSTKLKAQGSQMVEF
jgi:hypothetical protein